MRKLSLVIVFALYAACGGHKKAATTPAPAAAPAAAANAPCETVNCAQPAAEKPCMDETCGAPAGNVSAEPARITLPPFKCDTPDGCVNRTPAAACDQPDGCVNREPAAAKPPCEDPAGCV